MQLALCPACRVVHEVKSPSHLVGLSDERAYDITHCRLCERSSGLFLPLKDAPPPPPDDLGFPSSVVPVFDGQYRDWCSVGAEQIALLAQAGLRIRLTRHLADEMELPVELLAGWIGLSADEALHPSPGTMLDQEQGERLLWTARLIGQLQEMVDHADAPRAFKAAPWIGIWLQEPHHALDGQCPGDYLRLPDGRQALSNLLGRLERGAYF